MAEDVIEFGPEQVATPRRKTRYSLPPMLMSPAFLVAALGFLAIVISWIVPWQTTSVPDGPESSREISVALAGAGSTGQAYVVIAVGLLAAVMVTLFGQPSVRGTARLIGLALAGGALALMVTIGLSLTRTSVLADFRLLPQEDLVRVIFTVELGVYLAAAGLAALGVALVVSIRPYVPTSAAEAMPGQAYEEEPMELEVAVFPASPKAGAGPGHEIWQRP